MTFEHVAVLRVFAWGKPVGALAPDGRAIVFEYEPSWRRTGVELAPVTMPLRQRVSTFVFPALNPETFHGLPPMLADSVPDRFGNGIIDNVLAREGVLPGDVTALDRLAYVGRRGMGALTFEPDTARHDSPTSIELNHLVEAARAALRGDLSADAVATDSLNELIQVGTSAGGARAKAVIAYNPSTDELRAGGVDAPGGFEQWLLKFDGVGPDHQLGTAQHYGRTEYAYYLMATDAGITMSPSRLLEEGGRAHFMTRRFNRPGANGAKLHLQSLCAISALDFNAVATHDYASLFTAAEKLAIDAREEIFRRMVFNVLASNNDDHTKNHAFLMAEDGTWSLSPAYDVTFAYNPQSEWTQQHLMSVNGRFSGITAADLHAVGEQFRVPGYRGIIRDVEDAITRWPVHAREAGVPGARIDEVSTRLAAVALN
ncbi:type II toxin-antitoxin system HipA family toxin [Microcella sp.]|uniref:type II toxin-antitoxin system HipA family toxin n=1 Tax=Microcella sp. TaxID=1913979 RepID=UPI00299F5A07|nr:type II toxin-antitoxin system HipA family toxin [Microcella sp.]MDX2025258.1 type II toxin-antitoxin system HipA family toxin [Microcella sp.]